MKKTKKKFQRNNYSFVALHRLDSKPKQTHAPDVYAHRPRLSLFFCCANFNYKLCPRNCTRLPFAHTQQIMWIFRHILNGICLLRFYVNFRAWILVADLIFVSTWNTIHKRSNWFNITLKWICLCLCVQNNWINKQIKCRVCGS